MQIQRDARLRIGGAIARYFASGGGPSHTNLNSAFARCSYGESQETKDQSKESRVLQAFTDVEDSLFWNLVDELLVLLRNDGSLQVTASDRYRGLIAALGYANRSLDKHGFLQLLETSTDDRSVTTNPEKPAFVMPPPLPARERPSGRPASVHSDSARRKVFVSHATKDSDIALRLARLLRASCKLDFEEVVCTSVPEFALPEGRDWKDELRNVIEESAIVVFYLSPAFMSSRFCGFEMGAAWFKDKPDSRFPIREQGFRIEKLDALAGNWQCAELGRTSLVRLVERAADLCGCERPSARAVNALIDEQFGSAV